MPSRTKNRTRRTKRSAPEGYKWAKGGRYQEKDLSHPMWNIDGSSDSDSEEDEDIDRIALHANSGDKHLRSDEEEGLNGTSSKRLKTVPPQLHEQLRVWCVGVEVDMHQKEFGLHLLKLARQLVESKEYLVGAAMTMCEELGITVGLPKHVYMPPDTMAQVKTPKGLKVVETSRNKGWDSNIYFTSKKESDVGLSYTAAISAKSRDVHRLKDAMKVCGTVAHATVAIHHYITKVEPQIGVNLGTVRDPDEKVAVAADLLRHTKSMLHSPRVVQKNTNDSIAFQKTLFSVIAPTAPPETATKDVLYRHRMVMKQIVSQLDLSGSMRQRVMDASKEKRDLLDADIDTVMDTKLIKSHRRKEHCNRVVTPEFLESFKAYLLTCEVTYDSPNRKDCVIAKDTNGIKIKNDKNGGFVKSRNRYYQRGLGWLYKHASKPVGEGGFAGFRDSDGNICVSQTTMERMMPHNYKRMTNTLKSSCRCANCLDAEYLHEDLMTWRNQHLKDLQSDILKDQLWLDKNSDSQSVITYQRRAQELVDLKQELVDFRIDVFEIEQDGSFHQKITSMEEALDLMTCQKVGVDKKFHQYSCCLGRCDQCPSLPPNRGETHEEADERSKRNMIVWRKHEHRLWCKLHGAIESGQCAICQSLPEKNRPMDKPRKSYDPVKKTAPIGVFMREHYSKFNVEQFRLHCFQRRALGKNYCKLLRDPYELFLLELHVNDVHSIWDFADRMNCEYNNATMTEGMGGSAKNIGMEGCCYHLFDKESKKVERHWYGFLSDEKQQDARICFVNRCRFIEDMKSIGKLTEGSTLWVQTDGCGKQYKCHNFMQMHILLSKKYRIKIDVMVTTAGHGKCLVDSLAGTDKHHLDHGRISEMDATRVDEYQMAKSEAHKACVFLSSVDRMLGSYKHRRQTKDQFEVKSRKYSVSNYDATKTEVEARDIPFKNTNFGPVSGWKKGTKNGIKEMFHFRFDYRVVGNIGMARRIPCACSGCRSTLDLDWVGLERNPEVAGTQLAPEPVHPSFQPSYQGTNECVFRPMMLENKEDLNCWHFIEIAPMEGKCDDAELDDFFTSVMSERVKEVEGEIVVGGIGALSAATDKKEHGFHLIEWTKKPHTLQKATKVFGMKDKVAAGQVVCEGIFWSRVDQSNDWYEPQENLPWKRPKKIMFLLSQVLSGKAYYKPYVAGQLEPPRAALVSAHNRSNMSKLIRLGAEEIDFLQAEQLQREGFELLALDKIDKKKHASKESTTNEDGDAEYIDDTWEETD